MSVTKRINDKAKEAYRKFRTSIAFRDLFKKDNGDLTQDAEIVLKTLSRFCYADNVTMGTNFNGAVDPLKVAFNEGRRSVYLYILKKIKVTDKELKDYFEEIE
ncbi:MAG: hypothetical protein E6Q33_02710 [Neisseriales bacterium]|nr:MAG: hypothetical protein E6Q33_02710 [Neisseriales bacterium]